MNLTNAFSYLPLSLRIYSGWKEAARDFVCILYASQYLVGLRLFNCHKSNIILLFRLLLGRCHCKLLRDCPSVGAGLSGHPVLGGDDRSTVRLRGGKSVTTY